MKSIALLGLVAITASCGSSSPGHTQTTNATVPGNETANETGKDSNKASSPTSPAILAKNPDTNLQVLGPHLATANGWGMLETVATFEGQMPTGVAVEAGGRIFLSFPHWADPITYTVAELKDGRPTPFPDENLNHELVSVQSVYVDSGNHLWILDTGSVNFGLVAPNAAKLIEVDLVDNKPQRTITFPEDVVLPQSYLNDVRIDLKRGKAGVAYITDSSTEGSNAIVVVDLDSKKSWRKLVDHPSVKAAPGFLAFVESQPLYRDASGGNQRKPFTAGVDGIALSADAKTLYYSPLASRHLYSVPTDPLADPNSTDAALAKAVVDHGDKGASDGLETDDKGRIYATSYESNSIVRLDNDGSFETVVSDPRLLWPDTLALADDGYLYVTSNQLHRQAMLHHGEDQRTKPYVLFRVKIDGTKAR
jgi:sugar lactone lactonase YvrE